MTAIEIIEADTSGVYSEEDIVHMMIEFAKYHVKLALEEASNKFDADCNKYAVLNSYSLENIK